MSIEVKILLGIALLIHISLAAYFMYRASRHDYTSMICNRCGSNKLKQGKPVTTGSGEKIVSAKCEECGFEVHEVLKEK